jgi:hypothetical protein
MGHGLSSGMLAPRPLYPGWLPTCCTAQVGRDNAAKSGRNFRCRLDVTASDPLVEIDIKNRGYNGMRRNWDPAPFP